MQSIKQRKIHITTNIKNLINQSYVNSEIIDLYKQASFLYN